MKLSLKALERRHPEWRDWFAEADALLAELRDPAWDRQVPTVGEAAGGVPLAIMAGMDPERTPVPLLHACSRSWAGALPQRWAHGYCPVCGGWPAFAEACGVERSRYLRCVRCGSAWRAQALSCPYCGNRDHGALGALVPEEGAERWTIEFCTRCRGYLKVLAALRPAPPEQLLLEDLGTVELDLAAEARGYARPEGPGYGAHVAA